MMEDDSSGSEGSSVMDSDPPYEPLAVQHVASAEASPAPATPPRPDPAPADGGEDEEDEDFDITLAPTHSYLGPGLAETRGRAVLEAGWRGLVPVLARPGVVFPGRAVPLLLPYEDDADQLRAALDGDKLFGLLCPDEAGSGVSGYGALCEVAAAARGPGALSLRARALYRLRLDRPHRAAHINHYARVRKCWVQVLPERSTPPPPRALAATDVAYALWHKPALRRLSAALTPWPAWVYELLDPRRMRDTIADYFKGMGLEERVPHEATALSFWTAGNLPLAPRAQLQLLRLDHAALRLRRECRLLRQLLAVTLCCAACAAEVARSDQLLAMSSDGVGANYTNLGGYSHDILTVRAVGNVRLSGEPSAEYSWFPRYAWTVALCGACGSHLGWRFTAEKRNLRPAEFYGICRNYVQPRPSAAAAAAEASDSEPEL